MTTLSRADSDASVDRRRRGGGDPATYRYLANNFDEAHKGTALGIFSIGGKMGPALGAPIAAWLIVISSWKMMFVVTGLAGLVWLVPWLLMLDNDFPSRTELAARSAARLRCRSAICLSSPVVWGGLITNFCYSYFAVLLHDVDAGLSGRTARLSLEKSGLYTFFSFAGIAIVAAFAGWAADRMIARGNDAVLVRKSFIVAGFIWWHDRFARRLCAVARRWRCSGTCSLCRCSASSPPTISHWSSSP